MMKPLKIDVDFPSNTHPTSQELNQDCIPLYEMLEFEELQFPDYCLFEQLGRGAHATVMPCHFHGKPAAAKLFNANVDFKTIQKEAKLLHEFRHENIIELYALFHGTMSGLVLELMGGGSLSELIHQRKSIVYQNCHVINWTFQVAKALEYLHKRSFIHRDVKPSNMLLSLDYVVLKLCDFGTIAKHRTDMASTCGTAAWMAPEVFRGESYDFRCDVFSLGICLWEMLARSPPFADASELNSLAVLWEMAESGLRPPSIEGVAEPLQQLMVRCWADEPNDRPPIDEVKETLEALLKQLPHDALSPFVGRTLSGRPSPVDFSPQARTND